ARAVIHQHPQVVAIENRIPYDVQPVAFVERQPGCAVDDVVQMQTLNGAVAAVAKDDAVLTLGRIVVERIPLQHVGTDDDLLRVLDKQIVGIALPKRVTSDGYAADTDEVNVGLNVGEHIVPDGHIAAVERHLLATAVHETAAEDADIR